MEVESSILDRGSRCTSTPSYGVGCLARRRWSALRFIALVAATGCSLPDSLTVATERDLAALIGSAQPIEFRSLDGAGVGSEEFVLGDSPLALPAAIERALRVDQRVQIALARVRVAAAQADQARSLPNPVLNVVLRFGGPVAVTEASLGQEILSVVTRPARVAAADDRLRAAAAAAMTTALDVVLDVESSYLEAQSKTALLTALRERLALLDRSIESARARLDGGEGTRSDVVTLAAQRIELEVLSDNASAELEAAKLDLIHFLGVDARSTEFAIDPWSVPIANPTSETAWIEQALRARPEIQAQAWRLAALGDDSRWLEFAIFDPATVGIDAERGEEIEAGPAFSLPLPIFDRGTARIEEQQARIIEARHESLLAKREVIHEVRKAYRAAQTSERSVRRIRDDWLPRLTERRRLAEDDYRAGQTDLTPLILAEHDLRVTQMHALELETVLALAQAKLRRAAGGRITNAELSDPSNTSALPSR